MSTLFSGIHLALRALLSHQESIQVIEHNVANANTPGYRRQEAVLAASPPYAPPGMNRPAVAGQIGTGVEVQQVRRYSLEFMDRHFRSELSQASRWDMQYTILAQTEVIFSEMNSDGLSAKLDAFWTGWQALSVDPANQALRADLFERSQYLVDEIHRRQEALITLRFEQDLNLSHTADEINQIASQIGDLNSVIANVFSVGDQPNDLLDQRDLLLDRLAELSGAVSNVQTNGDVMVSIGGHALVISNTAFQLTTAPDPANANLTKIVWTDGQDLSVVSGKLAGLIEARDGVIVDRMTGLDSLASTLISRVNPLHQSGYGLNNATGLDFFTGTDALTMRVNTILSDHANIATAAAADSPGDGSIATQISDVRNEMLMSGGTATLNQYYSGEIANLGLEVKRAKSNSYNSKLLANALDEQRQSVSGVSLDEEAANLIQSQRAYQAAIRLMTAVDEMLDRIINSMGRVGL